MENVLIQKKEDIYLTKIVGELILENVEELKPRLEEILEEDWKVLGIDLSEIQFMDSSGIGFLVALSNKVKQKGKKFVLVNPSVQVIKTLKLVNIYHFFDKVDDSEDLITLIE
ncbi:anti-sigma B factor antagonist [Desulfonauticus submarinus]|uniref:Anti-sigma factor antagonist n=1 Tax=Desulfonauticus submarinus TaxID=206665 RepID=A0A1G9ZRV7_9BACT|nr:STAS domain-containing protein [Desulfonauticus submarinus]SDN23346.1 anti-sigma B factor antagonist [Desulfonauticus submarinus]